MSIVRSLLINIGFKVDKRAIANTNQAITGFKTRFAIAASAATYAFSKITQFFGDVATATLDSKELADNLGIAFKELVGLEEAGKQIRIMPDDLRGILRRAYDLYAGFVNKTSTELETLAMGLGFTVDPSGGFLKVLDQIVTGLQKYEDVQQQVDIAERDFSKALGSKLVILSRKYDKFTESAKSFAETIGQQKENALPALAEYEQAIVSIGQQWQMFAVAISKSAVPALTKLMNAAIGPLNVLLGALENAINLWESLFSFDLSKMKQAAQQASKFLDPLFEATGLSKIENAFKGLWGGGFEPFNKYIENRQGYGAGIMTASPVINNTINVPPGTTEDQAQYMSTEIRLELEQAMLESFIEIQNNNPTVE